MHLVPAEGALPYRTFYQYIGARGFPVTQFIRHGSHPEFTPEPDMIHDCLGHVPPLMNHDYAELLALIGKAVSATHAGEHVLALKRFSWFSIEFGLIEEAGETKVFGAGILSSTGEIPYSVLSPDVTRRPFVTDAVINTDYDPSRMQDHLFVAPSLAVSQERVGGPRPSPGHRDWLSRDSRIPASRTPDRIPAPDPGSRYRIPTSPSARAHGSAAEIAPISRLSPRPMRRRT